jgi:hypothetical protein
MPPRKKPLVVPQTSLIDMRDALAVIRSTTDVTSAALEGDNDIATDAAVVLHNCISLPLKEQNERLGVVVQHLVSPRRRKKRAKSKRARR